MKQILKIFAVCAISLSALVIGCVNGLSLEDSDSSARLNNISGVKDRAALKDLVYQGGSMLYNPSDSSVSQLEKGVIVATRAGMIVKKDLGNGEPAFSDPVYAASYGYIEITDIDKDYVSFDYYVSDGWKAGEEIPSRKGSYTLAAGQSVDLTGDGYADLKYTKPSTKRKGAEKAMWLTAINNPSETMESFMFSIIPEQYENKNYPGGLVNINDEGRYVVTKYDMSNRGIRSAVKSLSYGDYVIDNEESCFQIYVGSSSYGSARAVSDTELNEFDLPERNNPETYYFKPEEFAGSYSIYSLFEKLPASLVTVDYSSMNISDLAVELNKLLVKEDLWKTLVENNNSDEAYEVRKTMEDLDLSSNLITVVANRIVLNKLYWEDCPSFNTFGNTFSAVFQNFSFYLGEPLMDDSLNESFSAARVMSPDFHPDDENEDLPNGHRKTDFYKAMKELGDKFANILDENAAEAKKREEEELKKKEAKMKPEYVEYTHKLAKIKKEFKQGVRLSYDLGLFAKTLITNDVIRQLYMNTNFKAEVGIGGNLTILSGKFDFVVRFYTFVSFAADDGLKYTSLGSFFTKEDPVVFKPNGTVKTKDDMKKAGLTKEEMDAKIKENDKELSEAAGINPDNLLAKIISSNRSKTRVTNSAIRLTRVTIPLGGPYPIQFWFEAKMDLLYKYVVAVECNDFYVGGAFLAGFDVGMGVDWDYLNLLFVKIPRNFRYHSNSRLVKEGAFYAGTKYQSGDDTRIGISGDVIITPVLELKPGFGMGSRILGSEASVGVEMPVTFAFPVDTTIRYSVNPTSIFQDSLEFNTEAHFYTAVDFDVNAHLELLGYSKDFKFPVGTVGEFDMLLGRIHAKTGEETFTEGPRVISTTFLGKTY